MIVIDKKRYSEPIKERAAGLDGPAGPPAPGRNDANEYEACWQARSWFSAAAGGNDWNSCRVGDE
jgi:hypothetical protein